MGGEPAADYLVIDGRRIRYAVTGDGPAMVLLHGLGRSLEDWTEVHEQLGESHRVYTLDLPGFGGSERLAMSTDLAALASALLAFLDAVEETGPIRLVGKSLGGAVALRFAATHPERVAALILVDSAGFGREVTLGLRILAVPVLGRLLLRPSRLTAPIRARSVFYDHSLATPERVALQYHLASRPGAAEVFIETARSIGGWRGVRPDWGRELTGRVAAAGTPVLILWGSRDPILPARHLTAAQAALPGARVHRFEDTGHMPQLEAPDEFVEVVAQFLSSVGPN